MMFEIILVGVGLVVGAGGTLFWWWYTTPTVAPVIVPNPEDGVRTLDQRFEDLNQNSAARFQQLDNRLDLVTQGQAAILATMGQLQRNAEEHTRTLQAHTDLSRQLRDNTVAQAEALQQVGQTVTQIHALVVGQSRSTEIVRETVQAQTQVLGQLHTAILHDQTQLDEMNEELRALQESIASQTQSLTQTNVVLQNQTQQLQRLQEQQTNVLEQQRNAALQHPAQLDELKKMLNQLTQRPLPSVRPSAEARSVTASAITTTSSAKSSPSPATTSSASTSTTATGKALPSAVASSSVANKTEKRGLLSGLFSSADKNPQSTSSQKQPNSIFAQIKLAISNLDFTEVYTSMENNRDCLNDQAITENYLIPIFENAVELFLQNKMDVPKFKKITLMLEIALGRLLIRDADQLSDAEVIVKFEKMSLCDRLLGKLSEAVIERAVIETGIPVHAQPRPRPAPRPPVAPVTAASSSQRVSFVPNSADLAATRHRLKPVGQRQAPPPQRGTLTVMNFMLDAMEQRRAAITGIENRAKM